MTSDSSLQVRIVTIRPTCSYACMHDGYVRTVTDGLVFLESPPSFRGDMLDISFSDLFDNLTADGSTRFWGGTGRSGDFGVPAGRDMYVILSGVRGTRGGRGVFCGAHLRISALPTARSRLAMS